LLKGVGGGLAVAREPVGKAEAPLMPAWGQARLRRHR
jgi:hypothetical protein